MFKDSLKEFYHISCQVTAQMCPVTPPNWPKQVQARKPSRTSLFCVTKGPSVLRRLTPVPLNSSVQQSVQS